MEDDRLSEQIKNELEEITRRKGYLLEAKKTGNRASLKIIDEFLKSNKNKISIDKNLMTTLLLLSNHLINENVNQVFKDLNLLPENRLVLRLYLCLQMSNNFLDGFFLGRSFIMIKNNIDILKIKQLDTLKIFKKLYLIRMNHKEQELIQLIDENTGLIEHFKKAYRELFLSNSALLNDLAKENIHEVIQSLILTFFDGILTAKIILENNPL